MLTHYSIDDGSKPEILSTPTKDLSSIPVIKVDERVPPALHTPLGCHSRGPDGPNTTPPSPTLSTQSSVCFMASTALQDNKPEGGVTSLALINPEDPSPSHSPQPSNVIMTNTNDRTIANQTQSSISHIYPATCNTTNSVRSPVENLKSPAPPHVGSLSEIDEFENQIRDHWTPVKKVEGSVQAVTEAEPDDIDAVKARDVLPLFPRLRRGRISPFSSILKIRPPRIPKDDRVTL